MRRLRDLERRLGNIQGSGQIEIDPLIHTVVERRSGTSARLDAGQRVGVVRQKRNARGRGAYVNGLAGGEDIVADIIRAVSPERQAADVVRQGIEPVREADG